MAIYNEKVNSRVAQRLKKQGFKILSCDYDWEPIYVQARRNNIDVTVFDGKVYFDEYVVDRQAGTFGFREIDFVQEWEKLSDLKFGIGVIPNEINSYEAISLPELIAGAARHTDASHSSGMPSKGKLKDSFEIGDDKFPAEAPLKRKYRKKHFYKVIWIRSEKLLSETPWLKGAQRDYCIVGYRQPTPAEAQEFIGNIMYDRLFDKVSCVQEISKEEALRDFQMDNWKNQNVFGADDSIKRIETQQGQEEQDKDFLPKEIKYGIEDKWLHNGQKVKILNKYFEGKLGVIQSFMWNTGDYIVTMENGHNLPFRPFELEKVDVDRKPVPEKSLSKSPPALAEQLQSAFSRAAQPISLVDSPICRVTFCRTGGVADLHQFNVELNMTPANFKIGGELFLLEADERIKAYDKAAEIVGEDALSDYSILSAKILFAGRENVASKSKVGR